MITERHALLHLFRMSHLEATPVKLSSICGAAASHLLLGHSSCSAPLRQPWETTTPASLPAAAATAPISAPWLGCGLRCSPQANPSQPRPLLAPAIPATMRLQPRPSTAWPPTPPPSLPSAPRSSFPQPFALPPSPPPPAPARAAPLPPSPNPRQQEFRTREAVPLASCGSDSRPLAVYTLVHI